MNILITGAKGQLGSEIRAIAGKTGWNFIFTDIDELDITRKQDIQYFFNEHQIDCCINCAAYTGVDQAESEPEKARLINETSVWHLAAACNSHRARLIHISTDFVFDGKSNLPYRESDPVKPLSVYGKTKLNGEIAAASCDQALIIRTSWLYSANGNNFVRTMLRLGEEREEIKVVFDQTGTPTYAADLAEAILRILDESMPESENADKWKGVYHYSNEGVASWYDFAFEIFRMTGMKVKLIPVRSNEYPTPAARPAYSVLDKEKIKQTFSLKIPHWKTSLEKCLKKLI